MVTLLTDTMNRKIRRALAKVKDTNQPIKLRNVNFALDEFEQFDDIDRMVQKLEHGAIEMKQGRPVMMTKGIEYDVLSALEGWMMYWRMLADKNNIDYDDSAMHVVARRLENAMPLMQRHINEFKRVVQAQRALFRAIPRHEISSQVKSTQIKMLLDEKLAA